LRVSYRRPIAARRATRREVTIAITPPALFAQREPQNCEAPKLTGTIIDPRVALYPPSLSQRAGWSG